MPRDENENGVGLCGQFMVMIMITIMIIGFPMENPADLWRAIPFFWSSFLWLVIW
jgi:hypothetical protein